MNFFGFNIIFMYDNSLIILSLCLFFASYVKTLTLRTFLIVINTNNFDYKLVFKKFTNLLLSLVMLRIKIYFFNCY